MLLCVAGQSDIAEAIDECLPLGSKVVIEEMHDDGESVDDGEIVDDDSHDDGEPQDQSAIGEHTLYLIKL